MAIKSTVYKVDLQISDMDRHYYHNHNITLARHPSETSERLMVRILAFALHAHEFLQFTKGLSSDEEPDIWQRDLSEQIECWIELGQLDEKRIRKASHCANNVFIYTYQSGSASVWWKQIKNKLNRFENLSVFHLPDEMTKKLAQFCQRNMQLQFTIQDNEIWVSNDAETTQIKLEYWK